MHHTIPPSSGPEIWAATLAKENVPLEENGLYWRANGKTAHLYYVEDGKVLPIACEMPAVTHLDVLCFGETEHLDRWVYPNENEIPQDERLVIQRRVVDWFAQEGMRHDIKVGE